MLLLLRNKVKYIVGLFLGFLLMAFQPVWAAGPPAPSIFSNPLAVILLILMVLLLIIIGILANILVGAADVKLKKRMQANKPAVISSLLVLALLLPGLSSFAQDTAATTATAAKSIGGMSASTFYLMATVIFIELTLIIALLINIRFLLKVEKEKLESPVTEAAAEVVKKNRLSWWDRINKLKPIHEEAELDLGHEYDGIRELNNRLPPWWIYGFYLTIVFAVVYLWRFHISHTGPSGVEEYERSVVKAELKIKEYLKTKGDAVDENTVTMLSGQADLAEGKIIFEKSCASCHKTSGAGDVGPNLTDDFWIHGNDLKSVFKTIKYGVNAMPQWQNAYSNKQIAQIVSYVKTLHGTNPPNGKKPEGIEMKEQAPVADSSTTKAATDSLKKPVPAQ